MNNRLKALTWTLTLFIVLFHSEVYSQSFSHSQTPNLPQVGNGSIALADFNRDGFIDVFITGYNDGNREANIYLNQGDTTFLNLGVGATPVDESNAVIADFNNDNYPDVAYTGATSSDNVIFRLLINNQDSTFQEVEPEMPGVKKGEIAAADLNNNGYEDVVVTGENSESEFIANVYMNNGNLKFDYLTTPNFEGVYESALTVFDFNLDGMQDIFYSGLNESFDRVVYYYKNKGGFNFEEVNYDLPPLANGSMISFHAESDSYPDLFISGKSKSGDKMTEVYKNHSGSNLIPLDTLEGVYRSSVSSADYNNDGNMDLAFQGTNNDDFRRILVYRTDGGEDYFVRDTVLGKSSMGDIHWADLTRNNKQDLILSGYSYSGPRIDLWINENSASDDSPDIPVNLVSAPSEDSVCLTWSNAIDDITPEGNLEYNIFLTSADKDNYIVSPLADTSTGELFTTQSGKFSDTTALIQNLSESRYYWAVQSIDQTGQRSDFSVVDTFNICHGFSLGEDIHTCLGDSISIEPMGLDGDIEWYNTDNPDSPFSTDEVVSFEASMEDTIWATLTNSYGCLQRDTIHVNLYDHPTFQIGEDTSLCYDEQLSLEAGNSEDTVNWYNFDGELLAEDTIRYEDKWRASDSIFVEVTTPQGCVNRDTLFVDVFQKAQWTLGPDTSLCKYDSLTVLAPDLYQPVSWHVNEELFTDSAEKVQFSVDKPVEVVLNVIDSNGCQTADTLLVEDKPLPESNAGKDTLICPGTKAVIGPDGFSGELSFSWRPTEPLDDASLKNPLASPDSAMKFFLEVTNQYGCTDIDSSMVRINPSSTVNAGSDTSVCLGDTIGLGGNPTAEGSILPYNYKWEPVNSLDDPGSTNPLVWPNHDTEYKLVTYTAHCPVDTAFVEITVNPLPDIAMMNDSMVGYDEPFNLWAKGGQTYRWYPETGLEYNDEARVRARITREQTYNVEVTNEYGCSDTGSVHIGIKDEIFVPELFTPNGDGKNDAFKVYGFGIKRLHFRVFTMEGRLVYETRDVDQAMNEGWDGTYRGRPLESGKYIWTLEGEKYNGEPVRFDGKNKGTVILIR